MKLKLIDTHAHLNLSAFDQDHDQVIQSCLKEEIGMINVGTNYQTSVRAVDLAKAYPKDVWAAIGLHPIHLGETEVDDWELDGQPGFKTKGEIFDAERYFQLAQSSPKVVAIGEIGLDYWHLPKDEDQRISFQERQKEGFLKQLDLAETLKKPVIIHCRSAFPDLISLLQKRKGGNLKGVIHCFTGDWAQAQFFLKMGFYLGFDGVIFKTDLDEVIRKISSEKMLVETDCPYLTPPIKKGERNTPLNLKFIVQKIADLRQASFDEIAQVTTANARNLFHL